MGDWKVLGHWEYSENVTSVEFFNLFGVSEVLIDARKITGASVGILSFWAGSNGIIFEDDGDYSVAIDNVEFPADRIRVSRQQTVEHRSARASIEAFNVAGFRKPVINYASTETMRFNWVDRPEALDCVQVRHDGGAITGGSITVYGR